MKGERWGVGQREPHLCGEKDTEKHLAWPAWLVWKDKGGREAADTHGKRSGHPPQKGGPWG